MDSTFPNGNPDVRINRIDVLSDAWYTLRRADFAYRDATGNWNNEQREAYDRGNGATILLVDWDRQTVVLTRQFRMPAYLNGHNDGMLIEAPLGCSTPTTPRQRYDAKPKRRPATESGRSSDSSSCS